MCSLVLDSPQEPSLGILDITDLEGSKYKNVNKLSFRMAIFII